MAACIGIKRQSTVGINKTVPWKNLGPPLYRSQCPPYTALISHLGHPQCGAVLVDG